MADHLVTGLLEVQVTCGNLSCGRKWRQPGLDPLERVGWLVCPSCNWSAPTNVSRDLGTNDERTDRSDIPPDEFWREVPCGHPPDPIAWAGPDGPVCHCGGGLDADQGIDVPEAPGPVVLCSKCGCHVAVPA